MNSKSTWIWGVMAAVLFAFIFFFERNLKKSTPGPLTVLSGVRLEAITSITITPANRIPIHIERNNASWQVVQPIAYPGEVTHIEAFLAALTNLISYPPITPAELHDRAKADEEFGFVTPQATVVLFRGEQPIQILFGSRTAPGDQVFLRVIGLENIFIVDTSLLDLLPRTVDDWRDRSFVPLAGRRFDHLSVLASGSVVDLVRDTNTQWKLTRPLSARVDNEKLTALLSQLPEMRVIQFASDHARNDMETFGLQPPDMEMKFSDGTNPVLVLQFGKALTNDAALVFSRRDDLETVVVISNILLAPWRATFDNVRDRHLLSAGTPIGAIEIHGPDNFTLLPGTNGIWREEPHNFIVDSNLMAALLVNLNTMQATQFVRDVATEGDLPKYGLAPSTAQLLIHSDATTNSPAVQIDFGTVQEGQMFAKRADEYSVYSVAVSDLRDIPALSWQVRNREVWNFNPDAVTNIVVSQAGHERQIVRDGEHSWTLAPGSQGIIQDLAIDQIVPRFANLNAAAWSSRAPTNLLSYGFKPGSEKLTFELKTGEKYTVEFGGEAPSQFPYATVAFSGEQWVFEFPWDLYQLMHVYISIPKVVP